MTGAAGPATPASDGVRVSVVVPVRNRSRELRELIDALWAQTLDPAAFEVIVVDNLSTDDTPDLVKEMQRESPVKMVYHRMQENNGPAHSRNTGVGLAAAGIVAFTDSDCAPCARWLELALAAMADDGVGFVTGPVHFKPGERVGFLTRTSMRVLEEHPTYPTANIVYRKSAFLELGGFDQGLCFQDFRKMRNECADTDLAWRVKKSGSRNVFVPEMIVYHEVQNERPTDWLLNPFNYYVIPALVKRHPELRRCLLHWRVFVFKENALFYMLITGLVLGVAGSVWLLLLTLPYLLWTMTIGGTGFSVARVPKLVARAVAMAMRQAVVCAGLIYGSIRFRALAL